MFSHKHKVKVPMELSRFSRFRVTFHFFMITIHANVYAVEPKIPSDPQRLTAEKIEVPCSK